MSIVAYTGLPGSGKSYTVVEQQLLPALKAGRLVVTNLPVYRDLVCQDLGVNPSMLREFPAEAVAAEPEKIFEAAPNGCVLILDEVWRLFPAGLRSNKVPEPFRTVFAEHRHRVCSSGQSMQIVLVTQDLAQIAAFARQLVETTFRTQKLTSIGQRGRFRTDIFQGAVSGPNPNPQSALRQIFGRYQQQVYRYYKSHTQSDAEGDGADESPVDKRANVLMRPLMIAAPFLIVGLVWFGVSRLWHAHDQLQGHAAEGAARGARGAPLDRTPGPVVRSGGQVVLRPDVYVLFEVVDRRHPQDSRLYMADAGRVVDVVAPACRPAGHRLECLYRGQYYDELGPVDEAVHGPVGPWTAGPVPGSSPAGGPSPAGGQGSGSRARRAVLQHDGVGRTS